MDLRTADQWTDREWWEYDRAVEHWAKARMTAPDAKAWMKHVSVEAVKNFPRVNPYQIVRADGYCVLFEVASPWYSGGAVKFVNEILVLRVGDTERGFPSVMRAFDEIKQWYECDGICTGDAFMLDKRLHRVYERNGYKPEATSFFKGD